MSDFYSKSLANISNIDWYRTELKLPVTSLEITNPNDTGGHHGEVFRIVLQLHDIENQKEPTELILIAKFVKQSDPNQGYEREILIYKHFLAPLQAQNVLNSPKFYFGDYDLKTGAKVLIIEEIKSVQCGRFYGDTSPHNRGKDLTELTKSFPNATAISITSLAFEQIAKLHGYYWKFVNPLLHCDNDHTTKFTIPSYIKGSQWVSIDSDIPSSSTQSTESTLSNQPTEINEQKALSIGEQQYDDFISLARTNWPQRKTSRPNTIISEYLENIITYALEATTYEKFRSRLLSRPYTLIHSDFYPANCLLSTDSSKLYVIDYELTSVGQSGQDLSQFVISHLDPELRLKHEDELLQIYYTALQSTWHKYFTSEQIIEFETNYTIDDLRQDYIYGGSKWIWLIAVCTTLNEMIPDVLYQHFVDQLTHFFKTHNISIENNNVPLPRS